MLSKDERINVSISVIVIGFSVAVFYHYLMSSYWGMGHPHGTFLCIPSSRYTDFYDLYEAIKVRNYSAFNYLPVGHALFVFFKLFGRETAFWIYTLIPAVALAGFSYLSVRNVTSTGNQPADACWLTGRIFILSFLTYPFLFCLERANCEFYILILLLLFIYFYASGKYLASSIFLSIAIGMKIYPAIFILLFIADRKFKYVLYILYFSAVACLLSLLLLSGNVVNNAWTVIRGLYVYNYAYNVSDAGMVHGSSLYMAIKYCIFSLHHYLNSQVLPSHNLILQAINPSHLSTIHKWMVAGSMIFITYFVLFVEKELWRRVAVLTLASVLFPFVSPDYRLLILLVPLFLFFTAEGSSRLDRLYAIGFALLLIPKIYGAWGPNKLILPTYPYDISLSELLNPVIMSLLLAALVVERMKSKRFFIPLIAFFTASAFVASALFFWKDVRTIRLTEVPASVMPKEKIVFEKGFQDKLGRGVTFRPVSLERNFSIEAVLRPEGKQGPYAVILGNKIHPVNGFVIQQDELNQNTFYTGFNMEDRQHARFHLPDNKMTYLAITVQDGIVRAYLDSELVSRGETVNVVNNGDPLLVGNWVVHDRPFKGQIRMIRITNQSLSDQEIRANYEKISLIFMR